MASKLLQKTSSGDVILDGRKALYLPKSSALLVGDLHFEKASFLQMNGHAPLPAYDTEETLLRLTALVDDYQPRHLVVLGDSFHDEAAAQRLSPSHFKSINDLVQSIPQFTWILGNHDPSIPKGLLGGQEDHLVIDNFLLTHLPISGDELAVNICGHLHPKLKFRIKGRNFTHPCFAVGENRIILPSFGTYTGGLYVDHPAIQSEIRGETSFYVTVQEEIYSISERVTQKS